MEPCPGCLGDNPTQPLLRALGAVLGSLADLRYDARWLMLRASDVGAPHHRARTFLAAWPADRSAQDSDVELGHERWEPAPEQAQAGRPRPIAGRRGGVAAAHPEGQRRNQGIAQPVLRQRRPDAPISGGVPVVGVEDQRHGRPWSQARQERPSTLVGGGAAVVGRPGPGQQSVTGQWGRYAAAITRWENLTRPAPAPTDDAGRLQPAFVEWMQGLPAGWVTATPGLGRPAQLIALGNGVVPQQAECAVQLLTPFSRCSQCTVP